MKPLVINTTPEIIDFCAKREVKKIIEESIEPIDNDKFEVYLFSKDKKTENQFHIHIPRCSIIVPPISSKEAGITLPITYDSDFGYVFKVFKNRCNLDKIRSEING